MLNEMLGVPKSFCKQIRYVMFCSHQNQIHILKYTFSNYFFHGPRMLIYEVNHLKISILYKPSQQELKNKTRQDASIKEKSDTLFHCKVKPNNLFVLNELKECIQNTFLHTLYRLRLLNKHSLVPCCATFSVLCSVSTKQYNIFGCYANIFL